MTEQKRQMVAIKLENCSNGHIEGNVVNGMPFIEAGNLESTKVLRNVVSMPTAAAPSTLPERWYRTLGWQIVAAILAVLGGLMVAYIVYRLGWAK